MTPEEQRSFDNRYRVRSESWERTLEDIGVSPRYRAVPRSLEVHPEVVSWRGDPWSVTFLGRAGCGKTWQATRLAGELRCRGWSIKWFSWSAALQAVLSEIATPQDGKTLDALMKTDTLLLDDFLAERDSAFNLDKASLIIRYRYDNLLPTILTTNSVDRHGKPSLAAIYEQEPRLGSRLAEGLVIEIEGADRRGRK